MVLCTREDQGFRGVLSYLEVLTSLFCPWVPRVLSSPFFPSVLFVRVATHRPDRREGTYVVRVRTAVETSRNVKRTTLDDGPDLWTPVPNPHLLSESKGSSVSEILPVKGLSPLDSTRDSRHRNPFGE